VTYVYPVVSRRADGLSVGINLNPNNACNWRWHLLPGPPTWSAARRHRSTWARLEGELRGFLTEVLHRNFFARRVPPGMRRLTDLALSGNGEPTSATSSRRSSL